MQYLPFGRTGHRSSRVIFGAAALWNVSQAEADPALDLLLTHGINHIDTAATYGDAELRLGPWMDRHRQDFFLATKVEERTYRPAWDSIRRSLDRLRTDHVNLLQLHNIGDPAVWETVMGPGGALEAVLEAQAQGLARFIGVTGHGTLIAALHRRALERVAFDTVLLPYNYPMMQNPQYAADFEALLTVCQARNVAVQTIKGITRRPWGDRPHTHNTWYEPLLDEDALASAVHFVLARPSLFLNTASDLTLLPRIIAAADRFQTGPTPAHMATLAATQDMQPLFTTPM